MISSLVSLISTLPPELATFFLAALPIAEMRASLPLALTVFQLSDVSAITWSLLGNLFPIPFLLFGLPYIIKLLERIPFLQPMLKRYFAYLSSKHSDNFQKIGASSLGLITLLPLPGAGIWMGCLLAVLFDIKPRYSVPALVAGTLVEVVILFLIVKGALGAWSFLLAV